MFQIFFSQRIQHYIFYIILSIFIIPYIVFYYLLWILSYCLLSIIVLRFHILFLFKAFVIQFIGQSALYGMNKSLKNSGLFPSTFNVAAKADIFVNATCGEDGPETFCKPSESSRCGVCDARSPDPGKRHNISNILDSSPGKWWQSPTLAKGDHYEYVTIVLDLKQVRCFAIILTVFFYFVASSKHFYEFSMFNLMNI